MFRSNSDKINHKDIKTLADSIGSTLASRNKIAPFAQNKGRQDCEMRNTKWICLLHKCKYTLMPHFPQCHLVNS